MPGLHLGKAVSDDDCDALATHARNRLQSDRDDRCQDSRAPLPLCRRGGTLGEVAALRTIRQRPLGLNDACAVGKEGCTNRAAIGVLVATSAHLDRAIGRSPSQSPAAGPSLPEGTRPAPGLPQLLRQGRSSLLWGARLRAAARRGSASWPVRRSPSRGGQTSPTRGFVRVRARRGRASRSASPRRRGFGRARAGVPGWRDGACRRPARLTGRRAARPGSGAASRRRPG
jgi:hypothetical protein